MVSTMRDKEVFLLAPGDHANSPVPDQPQSQGCILIVEDDAPTLRLERVLLEEEGYSVDSVGSGEEAIEAVTAKKPSLVLLDIGLPDMDGFTTCQRIRELSRVPIIMVTGRDCLDDKVKGMNVGADDYVTKPFLTHELATRVKVILRRTVLENAPGHYPAHYMNNAGPGVHEPPQSAPQQYPSHSSNGQKAPSDPAPFPVRAADTTESPLQTTGEEKSVPSQPLQTNQVSEEESEEEKNEEAALDSVPAVEADDGTAIGPLPDHSQQISEESAEDAVPEAEAKGDTPPEAMPDPSSHLASGAVEDASANSEKGLAGTEQPGVSVSAATTAETVYEGTVRLTVTTLGPVSNLINFVSELRQNSHYRLLRLVANQHKEGMDIWLGLREPAPLLADLMEVQGVVQVTPSPEGAPDFEEPSLAVLLD